MQQRVPEGSEPSASPEGSQPSMEAEAEVEQGSKEEGVHLPGEDLRPPRSVEGTRRPHRHQEALQQEARREEVEV